MQRTKQSREKYVDKPVVAKSISDKKLVKWINSGGNYYPKNKECLKPGETFIKNGDSFLSAIEDIPEAFRKTTIHPADPAELERAQIAAVTDEAEQAVKLRYTIKQRKNTDYFDIFDPRNKKLNDKDLTEAEAQDLLDKLMSE
jgi:hypothetical protein